MAGPVREQPHRVLATKASITGQRSAPGAAPFAATRVGDPARSQPPARRGLRLCRVDVSAGRVRVEAADEYRLTSREASGDRARPRASRVAARIGHRSEVRRRNSDSPRRNANPTDLLLASRNSQEGEARLVAARLDGPDALDARAATKYQPNTTTMIVSTTTAVPAW
jgi:hypothetical protein